MSTTLLTTSTAAPLAVRVRNARYDQLITGFIVGGIQFQEADPGGFISASFTVSQRLKLRSEVLQDYSRVYVYDKRTGDTVFEGDITHPGYEFGVNGALLQVQVDGANERLNDWMGARIYCDSDLTAWTRTGTANAATSVEAADDRGGSGADALNLNFPTDLHVDTNFRCEAIYQRIAEAGQILGRINYSWDGGHTSGSPGWLVRLLASSPSVVARSQILNVSGSTTSGAFVGVSWADTAVYAFLQLIWTSGASGTGTSGNDIVWVSIMDLTVVAYLYLKDGTRRTGANHTDYVTAVQVWEDMLGDPLLLGNTFNGPAAQLDTGIGFQSLQLAFPDGITPQGIADELMKMETNCTYLTGPSSPVDDRYSLTWLDRPFVVRYEVLVWADQLSNGTQPVEQYNRVVARWRTKTGNLRISVNTQTIPEMDAVGRTRTFFQDLSNISGETGNAAQMNSTVLTDHRYPLNAGQVTVTRPIVDLFTGRRVMPWEIKPAYLVRLVGVEPTPDGLNSSARNGSTVCRIVTRDYDSSTGAAILALNSIPLSMFRAITDTRKFTPRRNG
jgi:hypothetical protein